MSDEQQENLDRVSAKIGALVLGFCQRKREGGTFHMEDLVQAVQSAMPENTVAPDSSSRILRILREQNVLDYEVISRKDSFYRVLYVPPMKKQAR